MGESNVTPVVLVKNDAYWLPYALESISNHFDRMVIYDVGSTDFTRDVIDWYVDKETFTEFLVRKLPHCPPEVQVTFRNSMIAEAGSPCYLIVDGDEAYRREDLERISKAGECLIERHSQWARARYGVFSRIEVSPDLKQRYSEERTHHRLYHRSAIWNGTHPGEVPVYEQNRNSELNFLNIKVLHLHNTVRSPKEEEALSRMKRKSQRTYHPGTLANWNVLEEYPLLKQRLPFPVCPALEALWG
jgi:hypothetical protein